MAVFAGSRRQRGGGILGSLKNFFMPLFTSLGKKGVHTAMNVAKNVVGDAISGKNIPTSLRQHGLTAAKRFGNEVLSSALGRKTGTKQKPAAKRKSGPSRKRAAPRKAKQTAKRVKRNF